MFSGNSLSLISDVEGGFELDDTKYETTEHRSVVILPQWERIDLPDGKPGDPQCSPLPASLPEPV